MIDGANWATVPGAGRVFHAWEPGTGRWAKNGAFMFAICRKVLSYHVTRRFKATASAIALPACSACLRVFAERLRLEDVRETAKGYGPPAHAARRELEQLEGGGA